MPFMKNILSPMEYFYNAAKKDPKEAVLQPHKKAVEVPEGVEKRPLQEMLEQLVGSFKAQGVALPEATDSKKQISHGIHRTRRNWLSVR
jgi:hypothetical protein